MNQDFITNVLTLIVCLAVAALALGVCQIAILLYQACQRARMWRGR